VEPIQQWSDFQLTMANGRQIRTAHFVLHQWQAQSEATTGPGLEKAPALLVGKRLGVVVPKRLAKRAVTRNLIRRQVKDLMRAHQTQLPTALYVVRLRAGFQTRELISAASPLLKQRVRTELQQLMQQCQTQP
jgi:ribonuclease P protein component